MIMVNKFKFLLALTVIFSANQASLLYSADAGGGSGSGDSAADGRHSPRTREIAISVFWFY